MATVTHQRQVSDAPGPTFHQSVPLQYYSQEVHQTHGDPGLHHNLGINPIPPYQTGTEPTPSDDSPTRQGGFPQTGHSFTATSDTQAEANPGANYGRFRFMQPTEPRDENAKYECEYCGKTFVRPSTLRVKSNDLFDPR